MSIAAVGVFGKAPGSKHRFEGFRVSGFRGFRVSVF